MKRAAILSGLLFGLMPAAMACELCEEQQPKWLRGVIHGPGPQSMWDYVIMAVSIIIVLVVLFYSIKFLVKPGEKNPSHVKYSILNPNESYGK
jgi:hypothetical protein